MEIIRANFERFPPNFELPEPWKGLPGISQEGIDWEQLGEALEAEDFMKFWRTIEYNRSNFRACLTVIHAVIETLVGELVRAKCVEPPGDHYTNLRALKRNGFFSHGSFNALNRLRRVRNRLVHEPVFEWESIQREFPNYPPFAAEFFYQWCLGVIAVLWNSNMDVLMPVFAPLGHRYKLGEQLCAPARDSEASDDR